VAIVFPRTDVMGFCGYTPEATPLRLLSRQDLSFEASGVSHGKDYGPGLWLGDFVTEGLSHRRATEFQAIMHSLDGVIGSFEACDLRKPYPAAYPTGAFDDAATLAAVAGRAMRLDDLAPGFVLTTGDYLSFDYGDDDELRALHQVMETVTADGGGLTPLFEVRPAIRPGYTIGAAITLKNPMGIFRLMPDSVVPRMMSATQTQIAFKAVQDA
jgi:hypothetical protein